VTTNSKERAASYARKKKALVAVAHKILTVVYMLFKHNKDYEERWVAGPAA
jgi:hypothetical protein